MDAGGLRDPVDKDGQVAKADRVPLGAAPRGPEARGSDLDEGAGVVLQGERAAAVSPAGAGLHLVRLQAQLRLVVVAVHVVADFGVHDGQLGELKVVADDRRSCKNTAQQSVHVMFFTN